MRCVTNDNSPEIKSEHKDILTKDYYINKHYNKKKLELLLVMV